MVFFFEYPLLDLKSRNTTRINACGFVFGRLGKTQGLRAPVRVAALSLSG
jgi:hypothetical protein